MHSERIILANYENIQVANHYANLLNSEGISCAVESFIPEENEKDSFPPQTIYLLKVDERDQSIARILLQSDDPWFQPQIQAPIGHQYRLIGAILIFVGFLCSFISFDTPQIKWVWFPLVIAGFGILIFIKGIRHNAEEYDEKG